MTKTYSIWATEAGYRSTTRRKLPKEFPVPARTALWNQVLKGRSNFRTVRILIMGRWWLRYLQFMPKGRGRSWTSLDRRIIKPTIITIIIKPITIMCKQIITRTKLKTISNGTRWRCQTITLTNTTSSPVLGLEDWEGSAPSQERRATTFQRTCLRVSPTPPTLEACRCRPPATCRCRWPTLKSRLNSHRWIAAIWRIHRTWATS